LLIVFHIDSSITVISLIILLRYNGIVAPWKKLFIMKGATHYTVGNSPTASMPAYQKSFAKANDKPYSCGLQV
jgi:hypothetical protein